MMRERLTVAAGLLMTAVLALSACGEGSSAAPPGDPDPPSGSVADPGMKPKLAAGPVPSNLVPPGSGDFAKYTSESSAQTKAAAMQWVALAKAGVVGDLGPVVINGTGVVLYRFDNDSAKPSKSTCTGTCAESWIPVLIAPTGTIYLTDVKKPAVGTVRRDDGMFQVTLGGWPLYRYVKDDKLGAHNGQGIDDAWFAVRPDGGKATAESSGTAVSIVLYAEKNLGGGRFGTAGPGCQSFSEPFAAASLKVSGGAAKIWSGEHCTGQSAQVRGEVRDLGAIAFGGRIASVEFGSARN
jgi:predicted lipoprotein with Yx(FWY)xxD motif